MVFHGLAFMGLRFKFPINQFILFAFMGGVGTLVHYAELILLVSRFSVDPVLASTAGAVSGALVNYLLNYRFTFGSRQLHRQTLPKFLAVAGLGFILNAALMWFAVRVIALHYLFGQIVATCLVLIWNYMANRHWTFAKG
jgi:putative flippase GtrA